MTNDYGIRRTFNPEDIDRQTRPVMESLPCFWPPDWVASENNWALIDDHGNIGLLDYQRPGVYEPHLYFSDRGREALDRAKAMIAWVFDNTDAQELRGKTPILKRGAWWVVRMIGFKRTGMGHTEYCPVYESIMTRDMWHNKGKIIDQQSTKAPDTLSGDYSQDSIRPLD